MTQRPPCSASTCSGAFSSGCSPVSAARARILESEALDIVPTRGTLVFRIAADRNFIAANRVLEIANPRDVGGARRPLEIVLYVRVAGET